MYNNKKVYAVIAAAGSGKRMGGGVNKQYIELNGIPVIARCLRTFQDCPEVDGVLVTLRPEDRESFQDQILAPWDITCVKDIVDGGAERYDSVSNALDALPADADIVLVQDGARPLVDQQTIKRVIERTCETGAAIPAIPLKDTVKLVDENENVAATPDRSLLRAVQTPQGFDVKLLKNAYQLLKAGALDISPTDDASLVEAAGTSVSVVMGNENNIKITTPDDIPRALAILGAARAAVPQASACPRMGTGFDVHAFAEDRKLILGGVEIPYERGLLGHSDADVLIHAIMDALLGAAALGDIGKHFPDSDQRYKGISSLKLLGHVGELIASEGYDIVNIDATVIAQAPKISPYIEEMRKRTAEVLKISVSQINIKGTTTERLGFTGRGEGIASEAAAVIIKKTGGKTT